MTASETAKGSMRFLKGARGARISHERSENSGEPVSLQPDDLPVQAAEERRSVFRRKRLRPSGDLPGRAQLIQKIARGERHADGILRERLAVWCDRYRA